MPSDEYEPKPFLCCNCRWIIGESYREAGKRITQLRVLRHPVALVDVLEVVTVPCRPATVYAVTQANDCSVICEHCGASTGWYANQNAIEMMIERRNSKRVREVVVNG